MPLSNYHFPPESRPSDGWDRVEGWDAIARSDTTRVDRALDFLIAHPLIYRSLLGLLMLAPAILALLLIELR